MENDAGQPQRVRARGHAWFARARRATATVLAVAASLISSFYVFGALSFQPGQDELQPTWLHGVMLMVSFGAAVALVWRHQHPVIVTAVALIPPLLLSADSLAALIALAALAASRRDRILWISAAVIFAATALAVDRDARRHPDVSMVQIFIGAETPAEAVDVPLLAIGLVAAVMTAVPLAVGTLCGARRDLEHGAQQRDQLSAEMARQEERTRIAREMHDVLGHRLSLLNLQAGALEVSEPGTERAAELARSIRAAAGEALEDLRKIIGVLRDGSGFAGAGATTGESAAEPALADIPDLIESTRAAGLPVDITVVLDDAASAPVELGTAVYRIVQESLTNVLHHAPDARATVTVRGRPGVGVTVDVANPVPEVRVVPGTSEIGDTARASGMPGQASGRAGTGLLGIRERVQLLGGNLSAGPTDDGTFVVAAWLPWAESP